MRVGQEDKFILRGDLTRSTGDKGSTTFKDRVRLWIQTSLWF